MPFNVIDALLVAAFVAIVAAGFAAGVVRVIMIIISLYLAVIAGGFFYGLLARSLVTYIGSITPYTAEIVAFLGITTLATFALTFSLMKTFASVRLPRFLAGGDQLGGAVLGVVAATFIAVITMVVLSVFFSLVTTTANSGIPVWPALLVLAEQARTSSLSRFFVELSLPVFRLIAPWFPDGLPAILKIINN